MQRPNVFDTLVFGAQARGPSELAGGLMHAGLVCRTWLGDIDGAFGIASDHLIQDHLTGGMSGTNLPIRPAGMRCPGSPSSVRRVSVQGRLAGWYGVLAEGLIDSRLDREGLFFSPR